MLAQGTARTATSLHRLKSRALQSSPLLLTQLWRGRLAFCTNDQPTPRVQLVSAAASLPHPSKTSGGEDAHFISNTGQMIGVADGVGGWAEYGVDAGLFAQQLMDNCKKESENSSLCRTLSRSSDWNGKCPLLVLESGFRRVDAMGTSTACVVSVDGERKQLQAANLGDSGFLLLRRGTESDGASSLTHTEWAKGSGWDGIEPTMGESEGNSRGDNSSSVWHGWYLVAKSTEQLHVFNCPRQLGTQSSDMPSHSEMVRADIQVGDVILAATDGFFDNVWPEEALEIMGEGISPEDFMASAGSVPQDSGDTGGDGAEAPYHGELKQLAKRLASTARRHGTNMRKESPFGHSAAAWGFDFRGGKLDDVTVVVSLVMPA